MHPHRLQQLVASVPDTIDADQRAKLLAHVQASDRCRVRIERVNAELDRVLDGVGSPDRAVDLACELDGTGPAAHGPQAHRPGGGPDEHPARRDIRRRRARLNAARPATAHIVGGPHTCRALCAAQ